MNLANLPLDQLRALLKLCREEGVTSFGTPGLSFILGPRPLPELGGTEQPQKRDETPEEKLERELFDQGQG